MRQNCEFIEEMRRADEELSIFKEIQVKMA